MFRRLLSETYRLEEFFDTWHSAAREARTAWETWQASAPGDRGDAYVS